MALTRYEFELLTFIDKGNTSNNLRYLSDNLLISNEIVKEVLDSLIEKDFIKEENNTLTITSLALSELENYRVKRAIILAAGFGSRMLPATSDRPKPLVKVNGVRIIDTLLDSLISKGIEEIYIVTGYKYEKWNEVKEKYPFVQLINNDIYDKTNNISSVMKVIDKLDNCYLCESDLYISNPDIITKYQYTSNILGSYSLQTNDWSFKMNNGYISDYQKGNTYCYNYYGISYWTSLDCEKLRKDFVEVYQNNGTDYFWEFVPLVLKKDSYQVEIRPCLKQDIMEIDNYYELQQLDASYK